MKKILFATIVPFWNRETGAQQRIFSLVKVLERNGHQVRIFFPGHAEESDHRVARQLALDVSYHSSDQPPSANRSLGEKLKWQFDAVVNALSSAETDDQGSSPLTLCDFRWPWAEKNFQSVVNDFSPDAIICEYITMTYLVESLPSAKRAKIHCMVDTHDLLSRRNEQFAQNDRCHWINITPREEAAALNAFDTVIAIQPHEAEAIQALTTEKSIIVVGHQPHVEPVTDRPPPAKSAKLTLGYLGSDNDSNTDAINQFLKLVWSHFKDNENLTLTIAGQVCERVAENLRFSNVNLLGRVSDLNDFYDLVDAAINPVSYGTGLKIKSVEAIAYQKPLLSTADGWVGEPIGGVTIVASLDDMKNVIDRWLEDPTAFQEARSATVSSSRIQVDRIYAPLLDSLQRL